MVPNEVATKQVEKAIRVNNEYIANAPALIARIIEAGGNTWKVNSEVTRIDSRVQTAKLNVQMATEALAKWTAGTLLEVDLIQEANDKKTEFTNTRRASLEAKLAKVPARKERALKHFHKQLKTWASSGDVELDARMTESCTKDYHYELSRIEFDATEWTTKLGLLK
jgi:hypothetical protein